MGGTRTNTDEINQIVGFVRRGYTYTDIAKKLDRSASFVGRIAQKWGDSVPVTTPAPQTNGNGHAPVETAASALKTSIRQILLLDVATDTKLAVIDALTK